LAERASQIASASSAESGRWIRNSMRLTPGSAYNDSTKDAWHG
jgi:hypothetical protein